MYKTKSGDTWDAIAAKVYGSESYVSQLMADNQKYLDYFIFPQGIELVITGTDKTGSILPDWRT